MSGANQIEKATPPTEAWPFEICFEKNPKINASSIGTGDVRLTYRTSYAQLRENRE